MERVLGYAPEEVIARGGALDAPEAAHPEDVPKIVAGFAEVLTNPGVGPPVRFRLRHKDGSWRHVEGFCNNLLHGPSGCRRRSAPPPSASSARSSRPYPTPGAPAAGRAPRA